MPTPAFLASLPSSSAAALVVREVAASFEIPALAPPAPVTGADPFTLPTDHLDPLFDLGESIVSAVQKMDRQTHHFLAMLAEFDGRRGWELGGHAGCADWLAPDADAGGRRGCALPGFGGEQDCGGAGIAP